MSNRNKSIGIVSLLMITGLIGFISIEPDIAGALPTHATIYINGNENFTSANGVTSGNGTENDPYIIEDWNINASKSSGIEIKNTSAFFTIINIFIYSDDSYFTGISLVNVTNGKIQDSEIKNNSEGILLVDSSMNNISNNLIYNNGYGILLKNSSYNTILTNNVTDNGEGIELAYSSNNNTLKGNEVYKNGYGILLDGSSYNKIVRNNATLSWSNFGIGSYLSHFNIIEYNNLIAGYFWGFQIDTSHNNSFSFNNVRSNNKFGFLIIYSNDNRINNNFVFYNNDGISMDRSSNNQINGNNFSHNFGYGISMEKDSNNNNIDNNDIYFNNWEGLYIESSINNSARGNKIKLNDAHAVYLSYSKECVIEGNDIKFNKYMGIVDKVGENRILSNNISSNLNDGIRTIGSFNTIIDGNHISNNQWAGIAFDYSDNTVITNNTITSNIAEGISLSGDYNRIMNNNISSNNLDGILMQTLGKGCSISGNEISSNSYGLRIIDNSDVRVIDNRFSSNRITDILIRDSVRSHITGNSMNGRGIDIIGLFVEYWNTHEIDESNTKDGKPVLYMKNQTGGTLPSGAGQIILANCINVTIKDQYISGASNGILLGFSNNNLIENNTLTQNAISGIALIQSSFNTIKSNTCDTNENGIFVTYYSIGNIIDNNVYNDNYYGINIDSYSTNNIVKNNKLNSNLEHGIIMAQVSYNTISNNTILFNDKIGIYLYHSWSNIIEANYISLNDKGGLSLTLYSSSNYISDNYIKSNKEHGLLIEYSDSNIVLNNTISNNDIGMSLFASKDEIIYHNNFLDNNYQVYIENSVCSWNRTYPEGGNYWSDYIYDDKYRGPEQNQQGKDGIGDKPYYVYGDVKDYYPLYYFFQSVPLTQPLNLSAEEGISFIRLSWDKPDYDGPYPIINHVVYRGTSPNETQLLTTIGDQNFYNDTSVINGVKYYYQVCAVNYGGEGELSEQLEAMAGSVPSIPQKLLTDSGDNYIQINWEPPKSDGGLPLLEYRLTRIDEDRFDQSIIVLKQTSYMDVDVTKGTRYYYRVKAVNALGEGEDSEEIVGVIPTKPDAPLQLKTVTGDLFINLTWSKPKSDGGSLITHYFVFKNRTSGDFKACAKITGSGLFFNDTDVDNGITYQYKVKAANEIGLGPFSEAISAVANLKVLTNEYPYALIQVENTKGKAPLSVNFSGRGFDKDGFIVFYKWDFGDGEIGFGRNVTHVYNKPGTFYVELTVVDNDNGSGIAMITITVEQAPGGTTDTIDETPAEPEKGKTTQLQNAARAGIILGIIIIIILLILIKTGFSKQKDKVKKKIPKEMVILRRRKRIRGSASSFIADLPGGFPEQDLDSTDLGDEEFEEE